VLDVIEQLPEPVTVDVFFRPLLAPYDAVSWAVFDHLREVLSVAEQSHRTQLDVRVHSASDLEAAGARQKELGVEGVNLVVFSNQSRTRKSVQSLFGDLAVVDWGHPTRAGYDYLAQQGLIGVVDPATWRPDNPTPARLSSFRGVEVLAEALLKVSSERSPRIYFSSGQGEPALEGSLVTDLSRLAAVLENDGFEVEAWVPAEEPGVPADADVLALVGATQPYPEETLEAVRAYVAGGGRVIAAPALEEVERRVEGSVSSFLSGYGMIPEPGVVCEPLRSGAGDLVDGTPRCAQLVVSGGGLSASHPRTEPLRRRNRRLYFSLTPPFRRGGLTGGGVLLDLVSSSGESWVDVPTRPGQYDFSLDYRSETRGRQRLGMLAELPAGLRTVEATEGAEGEGDQRRTVQKGRVLGIASAGFFSNGQIDFNRDFLLNALNWLTAREYRLRVSPLSKRASRLDLARSSALPTLTWTLYLGLPGACMAVGLFLAWRRRS
jgi:hypothetical protein